MLQNGWKGNFMCVVGLITMAALEPVGKTRHSSRFKPPGNKDNQSTVMETTASEWLLRCLQEEYRELVAEKPGRFGKMRWWNGLSSAEGRKSIRYLGHPAELMIFTASLSRAGSLNISSFRLTKKEILATLAFPTTVRLVSSESPPSAGGSSSL